MPFLSFVHAQFSHIFDLYPICDVWTQLCTLSVVGQYLSYTWHWTISESKCLSLLNCSGVAVIDGSKVLYTPFRYAVVPPPMSAVELQLPAQVSELAFSPLPNCNDFVALLTDFRIAVFSVTAHTAGAEGEESRGVVSLPVPELTGITRYICSSRRFVCFVQASLYLGRTFSTVSSFVFPVFRPLRIVPNL